MTDRPILFSAPMVRALLDGSKTQTRRVLKPQPPEDFISAEFDDRGRLTLCPAALAFSPLHTALTRLPRPGDRLWARETWSHSGDGVFAISEARMALSGRPIYRATDGERYPHAKYWPSIFMPREFSRLTLEVENVRVERLQDCSEEDAIAEGVFSWARQLMADANTTAEDIDRMAVATGERPGSVRAGYAALWDSINSAGAWKANPWVTAISFAAHPCNIDALTAEVSR